MHLLWSPSVIGFCSYSSLTSVFVVSVGLCEAMLSDLQTVRLLSKLTEGQGQVTVIRYEDVVGDVVSAAQQIYR